MSKISKESLEALFPPAQQGDFSDFGYVKHLEKWSGHVVSSEFRRMKVPARQVLIWNRLREAFGDEAQEVTLVLAFSPEEWAEVGESA